MTIPPHEELIQPVAPGRALDVHGKPKTRLRGVLHGVWTPVALIAGIVMIVLAPTTSMKVGCAIFTVGALMLFGISALYHLLGWTGEKLQLMRRLDHSNIFVFIAATYTPLALALLTGFSQTLLLIVIWATGLAGLLFRVFWLSAPRWLYTVLYVLMGWTALGWLGSFWHNGGPAVVILILAGGVAYTLGAVAYALKKPNLVPGWFGFHEVFHLSTIVGYTCHYIAIMMAMLP